MLQIQPPKISATRIIIGAFVRQAGMVMPAKMVIYVQALVNLTLKELGFLVDIKANQCSF